MSQQLMKFTGDLKALPYRELKQFATVLVGIMGDEPSPEAEAAALCDALIRAAEEINPDPDKKKDNTPGWR